MRAGESEDEVIARGMRLAHTMVEPSALVAEKQYRARLAAAGSAG